MMINELHSFGVQWKTSVAQEELHRVVVELEADRLEEGDVVGKHLLILKVKAHANHFVYVVVAEQVKDGCFALDILHIEVASWPSCQECGGEIEVAAAALSGSIYVYTC